MGVGIDFWLQLAVLLACLFFAAPRGGMTLGMMGGIGLVVFVFGFGLTPGPILISPTPRGHCPTA